MSMKSRGEKFAARKVARRERNAAKVIRPSKKHDARSHGDSRVGRGDKRRPGRG